MLIPIGFFGGGGSAGDYELISTTLISSNTSEIVIGSIPSTYKHLQIRYVARNNLASSGVNNGILRVNADAGSNYSVHGLNGNGSSVTSFANPDTAQIATIFTAGNSSAANAFTSGIVDILDYASTSKHKTIRHLGGGVLGTNVIRLESGSWRNTSAITSVTLTATSFSYASGTRVSIYGIKG
jgi:hypothetical protein